MSPKMTVRATDVIIPINGIGLPGILTLPPDANGIVLFAHGSGSSRNSPRNRLVAKVLNEASIGTLLFDLLTPDEDTNYETRFDIPLLTTRLMSATQWLAHGPGKGMNLGYFGASTGAAAALMAAAEMGNQIKCVVSRGGRPDLGMRALEHVSAATLLLVGAADLQVIELNQLAFERLSCEKKLTLIPGATHLFEEPGTLEEVARQATTWFIRYFSPRPQ